MTVKKIRLLKLIIKYKNNLKQNWDVIKDSIGKAKSIRDFFSQKIITNNTIVKNTDVIAKHFNTYLTEIGPILCKKIETPAKTIMYNRLYNHFSENQIYIRNNLAFKGVIQLNML